jgi:uncharacterized membrane protein
MQSQSVDAGKAISWYGFGWTIFMRSPGTWIVMMLLISVITLVSQIIPLIGPLLLSLISPALTGGLMYGASEAANGRPIEIGHLFRGLADGRTRTPMLILGGVMLALSFLLMIITAIIVGGSVGVGVLGGAGGDPGNAALAVGAFSTGMLLIFLITMAFTLIMFAALAFAIPLVMFRDLPPVDAVKSSVSACLRNVAPLAVFLIIYFILALIAAVPFLLGFLVLVPVAVAAIYAAYRDIYATDLEVRTPPQHAQI